MFNAFPNEDSVTPEVCKDYLDADPNVTQHIVRYENLNADLRFVSLGFGIRQKLWPHCLDNKASLCVDVFRRLGLYNITFQKRLGEITTAPLSLVNSHVRLLRLYRHPTSLNKALMQDKAGRTS